MNTMRTLERTLAQPPDGSFHNVQLIEYGAEVGRMYAYIQMRSADAARSVEAMLAQEGFDVVPGCEAEGMLPWEAKVEVAYFDM